MPLKCLHLSVRLPWPDTVKLEKSQSGFARLHSPPADLNRGRNRGLPFREDTYPWDTKVREGKLQKRSVTAAHLVKIREKFLRQGGQQDLAEALFKPLWVT